MLCDSPLMSGALASLFTLATSSELLPARSQMAFTLGFHIILASLGVAFPAMMMIANWIGLKKDDPVALELANRWSKVAAVTFAVGAVTGTVLSFEFGLLWPAFTGRFGNVFGILFAIEGIFFFLEAIFIAIYIFGWKRLSGWTHFWTGVPIVICGIGGAFSVVAVNSWMNQPGGFTMDSAGNVTDIEPLKVIFNDAVPYEVPHMILAAYLVTWLSDRVCICSRDAAWATRSPPSPWTSDSADSGLHRYPDSIHGRRYRGTSNRRGSADQVRIDGVRKGDLHGRDRVSRGPLH